VTLTASVGTGARAADPSYLADSSFAPFVKLVAGEAGAVYNRELGATSLTLRALYYYTSVDRDLIFNQQEGRNSLAPGTVRQGAILAGRVTNAWLDVVASATYANARFVREAADPGTTYFPVDQGDQVPYAPPFVARLDGGVHGPLPLRVSGTALAGRASLGVTYVSPRPLPFGERSDPMFVMDASAGLRWRWVEVGVIAQNLLDSRYQLGVYNYVSNFNQTTSAPDLLPVRHFTAGAPLSVLGTLTVYFSGAGAPAATQTGAP
jgi:iron complex outermembrane receptor protein